MCSIIGCRWTSSVASMLVDGLQRMEYRGYDSVGIATLHDEQIQVKKGIGKVAEVNRKERMDKISGNVGIGHTRWATHGMVCTKNAHPHVDTLFGKVAIVHNGVIDNSEEIRLRLGLYHNSDTDSEVIANLLAHHYSQSGDPLIATNRTCNELRGSFAFIALFTDGSITAARNHEPLILGIGNLGYFLASDVLGFIKFTDQTIYLDNKEYVIIDPCGQFQIFNFQGEPTTHKIVKLSKELTDVYKDEYAHFTLKEINEQPRAIRHAGDTDNIHLAVELIRNAKHVYITGSGSSYNAALIGKYLLNRYTNIRVEPIISSESRFLSNTFDNQSILVALSQSGESADVLDTVQLAKQNECKIIAIVNVTASSLANEASVAIGLNCGPEIGVAATKSFTSQLAVLSRITEYIADEEKHFNFNAKLVSDGMTTLLNNTKRIHELAVKLRKVSDIYVLGRGIHYPIASEASLKLKELAYIHAEGLPGGELKHGPLALMDEQVNVILINPMDVTYNDMLLSGKQIKARGAKIIGCSNIDHEIYDDWIALPTTIENLYPFLEIIPFQLLAYHIAIEKNTDPDYPRNLAKSVTVQ